MRLPGFVLTLGVHPARTELPRHTHDDPTLCYVARGRFTEYSRGLASECESGTLKLTPAGEPHWNRFADAETRGLRIDVDRARFAESSRLFRVLDERLYVRHGEATLLADRLLDELSRSDESALVAAEGLMLELLAHIGRVHDAGPWRRPPRWLADANEIVREQCTTRISLASVARTVGVQPETLARAYRRTYGQSVGEHIRALRIEHASRFLAETRLPLSEVALLAGFYDQSHFTNTFRRHRGITPSEARVRTAARVARRTG
ncbi:MAG TPA: AraC family transcriptional regulator [Gemmatimonadaceae bacterium]|nr:AraC family transcriptional regulator [Gemmatimonadaceae bacterium]